MSQFYDQASLVVVPSGYKAGTVYAQKPLTTDGQLAFTRTGDTASRVNSAGLIEKVRTNLVTYSNTFSNAAWTKVGGTTLTGGQTDPFGGSDAWKWEATGAATIQLDQNPAGSAERTVSIYAKSGNITSFSLWIGSAVTFNLSSGTITAGTGTITSVGNGWYRCTATAAGTSHNPYFFATTAGDHIFLAFAQMENGDIATDYIPTTTAAVSVGPVANVPRLDYTGSTCPRLLLEPQRTNLVANSENISGSNWTNVDSTDSINVTATLDPSGYYGADKLQETTTNAAHVIAFQNGLMSSANTYTFSSFLKAAERNWAVVYIYSGTSSFAAFFNLGTGVKGSVTSGATSAIESYGNGWYRCSITLAFAGSALANGGIITATADGTFSFAGTNGSGIYVWGAQLEAGAYATSYIPTLAASATRGADACSKTGISSLIGQTEGTIFVEVNDAANTGTIDRVVAIGDGTGNNRIIVLKNATGNIFFFVASGGSTIINQTNIAGTSLVNGNYKIAVAYKSGEYAIYRNGASVFTSTAATVPATSNYYLAVNEEGGVSAFSGKFSQALLFKTRLTNAQLAELTTL